MVDTIYLEAGDLQSEENEEMVDNCSIHPMIMNCIAISAFT